MLVRLTDADSYARWSACKSLSSQGPSVLAKSAPAIAERLRDSNGSVRQAACEALSVLPPGDLALYADAIVSLLEDTDDVATGPNDSSSSFRWSACEALSKLAPDALTQEDSERYAWPAFSRVTSKILVDELAKRLRYREGYAGQSACEVAITLAANANIFLLHEVAGTGDLQLCKALTNAGGLVRLQDGKGRTAEDVARTNGHIEVADFLRSCCRDTTFLAGDGAAFAEAMRDPGTIVDVKWFTTTLSGIQGQVGGKHSLLALTVRRADRSEATYVMERIRKFNSDYEEARNGVLISHWRTVAWMITEQPLQHIVGTDIKPGLTIKMLRDLAVDQGEYDLETNDCHLTAQFLFNECVADEDLLALDKEVPNQMLNAFAAFLERRCNIDVTRLELPGLSALGA
jgi:hypothetical protein